MMTKTGGAIAILVAALEMTACRAEIRGTVVYYHADKPVALPGATVTVLGSSLPEPRRAVSDRAGSYSFTSLKPGRYTVETSLSGFDGGNHELILTPGSVAVLEVTMWRRPIVDAHGFTVVKTDEAAVRAVVARYVDAREKRDAKLLEALFTADAEQLATNGAWLKGRENVVRGALASSQSSPGSDHIPIESTRFEASRVAIVDGRYEITEALAAEPRRLRTTSAVVRDGNVWRIAAIRNMVPTDPAR